MDLRFAGLDQPLSRARYTMFGLLLFFVKYNVDRYVSAKVLGRGWSPHDYLGFASGVMSQEHVRGSLWLVALAIPFIAIGVWLTLRRLRSLGWPFWLVLVFFVPYINLLFFALLCVWPAHETSMHAAHSRWLDRVIPKSELGSAAMGVAITAPLGLLLTLLSTVEFRAYAWGLFVGAPFIVGFVSVMLYCYHGRRSLLNSLAVSVASIAVLGMLMLLSAVEGIICLFMAFPLAGALALLGGGIAYALQAALSSGPRAEIAGLLILLVPTSMSIEHALGPRPETFAVTTAIDIDAPPATVWRHVVTFSDLAPPTDWWFRTGIAYPVRARIDGTGPGAIRHCEFSTGAFVEPIEVWDEPRLLKFAVTESPRPMNEWTPYARLDAPHLEGYFRSKAGQFLLKPLPGGRTRLEGTTWYEHRIWPSAYWRWWSDAMVHRIHRRVLEHIAHLSK